MPTRSEYKQALKGIPRDQRIAFLYLETMIQNKARPVEVVRSENQDWIKESFKEIENRITSIEALKKTLSKTIKDQRKEIDGKIRSNEEILNTLEETVDGLLPLIKELTKLREKLVKV